MICLECLTDVPHVRSSKRFCGDVCKHKYHRRRHRLLARGLAGLPAWHHGRFENYAQAYAGQVQVIITDPPYGRKHLPIYAALARFAETVLAPKGFLLCMCGWEEQREVLNLFHASRLLPLQDITYVLLGHGGQGRRPETDHVWKRHTKRILWYQQPGPKAVRRRSGTTDLIVVPEPTGADMDKARFKWEQSLVGFQKMVDQYTNNEDVICDPMMGTGTTLLAAWPMHRPRVIGIERDGKTFALADQRLREAGLCPPAASPPQGARGRPEGATTWH